jgi:hypothetical protein
MPPVPQPMLPLFFDRAHPLFTDDADPDVDIPDDDQLALLGGDKMLFAFVLFDSTTGVSGGTIGAQQTARGSVVAPEDCWIEMLVASSSQAAGFAAQFYDTGPQALWSNTPILFNNHFGSGQRPFFLKKPYMLTPNAQLQCRVTNLAAVANAVQLVGWGYRP